MKNIKTYAPPGTLIYTGEKARQNTRVDCYQYDVDNYSKIVDINVDEIDTEANSLWINVYGISDVELIEKIGKKFDIDLLTLEDILNVSQRSKFEVKEDEFFLVVKFFTINDNNKLVSEQVSMIFKKDKVLCFYESNFDIFKPIENRIQNKMGIIRERGSDYLFYALVDSVIDSYYEILLTLSEKIDEFESNIIENTKINQEKVYLARKEILNLKNAVFPLKEGLFAIQSQTSILADEEIKKHFRDVYDHYNQVYDLIMNQKEMLSSIYEVYMTNISNNMNGVMKTLTIFSAIFIPMSFLAGVFGMNFTNMPFLEYKEAFLGFSAVCVAIVIGMLIFFKRKEWL